MSYRKNDQVFQHAILENLERQIIESISQILRQEYSESSAAIKLIHKKTKANTRTIRNWYDGRNAPSSVHLVQLAKEYPSILRILLDLIGRPDIWDYCRMTTKQLKVASAEYYAGDLPHIYYEKNFVINVALSPAITGKLNQRQLWFLGLLQRQHRVKPADIAFAWQVTLRTAQADISGLVKADLICLVGAKKTGWYQTLDR